MGVELERDQRWPEVEVDVKRNRIWGRWRGIIGGAQCDIFQKLHSKPNISGKNQPKWMFLKQGKILLNAKFKEIIKKGFPEFFNL